VFYDGLSLWNAGPDEQERAKRDFGMLFQSGALWSSLTQAENIALPPSGDYGLCRQRCGPEPSAGGIRQGDCRGY
jgi:ABC-type transporter Mla maintaining outer membrane lipid asymmetry ATPase subunit MlaF